MKLSEVKRRHLPVTGYDDIYVKNPTISEIAQIKDNVSGLDAVNEDEVTTQITWIFGNFVVDKDDNPIEIDGDINDMVSVDMVTSVVNALLGIDKEKN